MSLFNIFSCGRGRIVPIRKVVQSSKSGGAHRAGREPQTCGAHPSADGHTTTDSDGVNLTGRGLAKAEGVCTLLKPTVRQGGRTARDSTRHSPRPLPARSGKVSLQSSGGSQMAKVIKNHSFVSTHGGAGFSHNTLVGLFLEQAPPCDH